MEYNHNWYEEEWAANHVHSNVEERRGSAAIRQGLRITAFGLVACMLLTALIGGVAGALIGAGFGSVGPQQEDTLSMAGMSTSTQNMVNEKHQTDIAIAYADTSRYTKAQIIEMCAKSVVGINCEFETASPFGGAQTGKGSGSGVIYTADGYIITNNHVASGATKLTVVLADGTEYPAEVIGLDSHTDLALLKINATGLTPAKIADSDYAVVGEEVVVIGNPLGEFAGSSTSGIISALNRELTVEGKTMTLIQTDAAVNPGNSGGGMFNSAGELIGIVNAKIASSTVEGLGFAIPSNTVNEIVPQLQNQGYVSGRAYLGVYTQNVSTQSEMPGGDDMTSYFASLFGMSMPQSTQVQVTQVVPGSAAERAGIQAGDVILAVDGEEISDNEALANKIAEYKAGETATITVQRDSQKTEVTVTFGENIPA